MGTEYSRLMEGMVDKLETRVKELEDERDRLYGEQMGAADWVQMSRDHLARADKAEAERDAALAEVERLRAASHGLLTEIVRSRKGSIGGIDTHYIVQLRCGQVDALFVALNPAPEPWPCGHKKTHPDEGCQEYSP